MQASATGARADAPTSSSAHAPRSFFARAEGAVAGLLGFGHHSSEPAPAVSAPTRAAFQPTVFVQPLDQPLAPAIASGAAMVVSGATVTGLRDQQARVLAAQASTLRRVQQTIADVAPAQAQSVEKDAARLTVAATNAKTLDLLAQTAAATGADAVTVSHLENGAITAAPSASLDSTAEYRPASDTVYVRQGALDKVHADLQHLASRGIIDAKTRRVLRPQALANSPEQHSLVVAQALIGVHEFVHVRYAHTGRERRAAAAVGHAAPGTLFRTYITQFEYDAYHRQEQFQFRQHEAPRKSGWLTIDNAGADLPRHAAVTNIIGFLGPSFRKQVVDQHSGNGHPGNGHPGNGHPGNGHPGYGHPGNGHPGNGHPGKPWS